MDNHPTAMSRQADTSAHLSSQVVGSTRAALQGLASSQNNRNNQERTHSTEVSTKTELSQFQNALQACLTKFESLGPQIQTLYNANIEKIMDVFDLPKLWEKFQGLSTLTKSFVVLGFVALMLLLKWATWELIDWVMPKLLQFLETENGKSVLNKITGVLHDFNQNGCVDMFGKMLSFAAKAAIKEPNSGSCDSAQPQQNPEGFHGYEVEDGPSMRICDNLERVPLLSIVDPMDTLLSHLLAML